MPLCLPFAVPCSSQLVVQDCGGTVLSKDSSAAIKSSVEILQSLKCKHRQVRRAMAKAKRSGMHAVEASKPANNNFVSGWSGD